MASAKNISILIPVFFPLTVTTCPAGERQQAWQFRKEGGRQGESGTYSTQPGMLAVGTKKSIPAGRAGWIVDGARYSLLTHPGLELRIVKSWVKMSRAGYQIMTPMLSFWSTAWV